MSRELVGNNKRRWYIILMKGWKWVGCVHFGHSETYTKRDIISPLIHLVFHLSLFSSKKHQVIKCWYSEKRVGNFCFPLFSRLDKSATLHPSYISFSSFLSFLDALNVYPMFCLENTHKEREREREQKGKGKMPRDGITSRRFEWNSIWNGKELSLLSLSLSLFMFPGWISEYAHSNSGTKKKTRLEPFCSH